MIHLDPVGLILLRKTCRLCPACEMLIADEGEVERAIRGFLEGGARRSYLVLGTLAVRTWREGLAANLTISEMRENMADFKGYMRVEITPRHWAPKDAGVDG